MNRNRATPPQTGRLTDRAKRTPFPSEVGPSAAGQCRLPDFGGKKLSQGDRLEKMKLNKIICVARFTI